MMATGEHRTANGRWILERSGDLGAELGEGLRAMPADSIESKADDWVGYGVSHSAQTGNCRHIARYGDDTAWPNVVWTIIGILSAGGLAVFLLLQ